MEPECGESSDGEWAVRPRGAEPGWLSGSGRRRPQYTRPFAPWDEVARAFPEHLDIRRFLRQRDTVRAEMWLRRRAHAPCDVPVPADWAMDVLYFRHEAERAYANRLRTLREQPETGRLASYMICFADPWVPYRWPPPQTECAATYVNFPPNGDLPDPLGGDVALESAWRLREGAIACGSGDPGRLVAETKKEHRDARKSGFLVPFQQVEFYSQSTETRDALYVRCPPWWGESWTSQQMVVPLPPVVTYRAGRLLEEKAGTPEYEFWWRVFESEWVALVFGRWCADIPQRGIMWRLPQRARAGLDELGIENLLHQCPYRGGEVREWLRDHDAHSWELRRMRYRLRGPTKTSPELIEERAEFVRQYPRSSRTPHLRSIPYSALIAVAPSQLPMMPPETAPDIDEIVASGSVIPRFPRSPRMRVAALRTRSEPCTSAAPESRMPAVSLAMGDTAEAAAVTMNAGWTRREPDPSMYDAYYTPSGPLPASGAPELSESLQRRLHEAGLQECLQYYAREFHHVDQQPGSGVFPVSEAVLVYTLGRMERALLGAKESTRALRVALATSEERETELKGRAERAELLVDVLADTLGRNDRGDRGVKRARYE